MLVGNCTFVSQRNVSEKLYRKPDFDLMETRASTG